ARYSGDVPRPPVTLVQQTKVVTRLQSERKLEAPVSKTVNITHVQNATALAPVTRSKEVRVTALSRLADVKGGKARVTKTFEVVRAKERAVKEERRQVERYRALAEHRKVAETKAVATLPSDRSKHEAPVKVKIDLPKTTPPHRAIKPPSPPPPP